MDGGLNWGYKGVTASRRACALATSLSMVTCAWAAISWSRSPSRLGASTVGGDLNLHDNQLESLPESFGSPHRHVSVDISGTAGGCTTILWRSASTRDIFQGLTLEVAGVEPFGAGY